MIALDVHLLLLVLILLGSYAKMKIAHIIESQNIPVQIFSFLKWTHKIYTNTNKGISRAIISKHSFINQPLGDTYEEIKTALDMYSTRYLFILNFDSIFFVYFYIKQIYEYFFILFL